MYEERSAQQGERCSSSTGGHPAASAASKLSQLQLFPDHSMVSGNMAARRGGSAGGSAVKAYAAGMRDYAKREAIKSTKLSSSDPHSSSSSKIGGPDKHITAVFLEAPLHLLDLQVISTKPSGGETISARHSALTVVAMQLVLEAIVLQEGEAAVTSLGMKLLRNQAARASREDRSLFISNRGQLLLEVLWLLAVDNRTYQQQQQHPCGQQRRGSDELAGHVHASPVELLCQLVHAEPTQEHLAKEGEQYSTLLARVIM